MQNIFKAILRIIVSCIPDLFLLIGYSSIVYGAYMIYQPSAFILGGALLLIAFYPRDPLPVKRKDTERGRK